MSRVKCPADRYLIFLTSTLSSLLDMCVISFSLEAVEYHGLFILNYVLSDCKKSFLLLTTKAHKSREPLEAHSLIDKNAPEMAAIIFPST